MCGRQWVERFFLSVGGVGRVIFGGVGIFEVEGRDGAERLDFWLGDG